MNNSIQLAGKLGLIAALSAALAGCVTHVHNPERTVYVPEPAPEPYTPPPAPAPAPVVLQPAPTVVIIPAVIHNEVDFHAPLSPYGEWIVVRGYGRVWRPRHVDVSWRPYAVGRWEWTEAGWYWVSEEPWGWATYHYGRWDFTPEYGWIWAPQTQWAPAWVTWREGAGYIGWAPLPPTARFTIHGALEIRGTIAPARFCFIETPRLLHPIRPTTVIVNNTTVVNKTVNVTKVKVVNNIVINEGPGTENIERATGQRLHRNSVSEVRKRDEDEARGRRGRDHVTGEVNTPNGNNASPRPGREVEHGGNRPANPATPAVTATPVVTTPVDPRPAIAQPKAPEPVRNNPKRTDREVEHGGNRPANPATPAVTATPVVTTPVDPRPAIAQPKAPEPARNNPKRTDREVEHGGNRPANPAAPAVAATPVVTTPVDPRPAIAQPQAPEQVQNNPTRPAKPAPQRGGGKPEKAKAKPSVALNNNPAPEPAVEPQPMKQTPRRGEGKPEKTPEQPGESAPAQPTAHIQPAPAPAAIPATTPAEPKELPKTRSPRETHPVVTPPQENPPQVKAPAPQTERGPAVTEIKSPKEESSKKEKEKANDKSKDNDKGKDKTQDKNQDKQRRN